MSAVRNSIVGVTVSNPMITGLTLTTRLPTRGV